MEEYSIEEYETLGGKCPFSEWFHGLKDVEARAKIRTRLAHIRFDGNFGQLRRIGSISELKINLGPGYRIYIGQIGKKCILLLCAGSKKSQESDIQKAIEYFEDYKSRG